ncbi:MAG: caspase family protein [Cohaesibacteraceae bacterium]|nr:caspase family protein [Cohaesibacteraceae bacterium]
MIRLYISLFTCLTFLIAAPHAEAATNRVALVIGNSAYTSISSLRNPVNDALLMARTLEASGFTVTTVLDADQKTMKRAMLGFTRTLRKTAASGLFYYAGHGVQVNGENYLIPLGVDLQDQSEIEIEAINVNAFVRTMENTQNPINIVILDACRNNPFPGSTRSTSRGLADVRAPRGTYMAYSTAPGQVSDDGNESDGNSPYTLALARAMSQPGLTIEQVFKQTRVDVLEATDEAQVPWENSSITGEFYFRKTAALSPAKLAVPESQIGKNKNPAVLYSQFDTDLGLWDAIEDSDDIDLFEHYLKQFPRGIYVSVARTQIVDLQAQQATAALASIGSSEVVKRQSMQACDLAAADPDDEERPAYAPGVSWKKLSPGLAIHYCRIALKDNPDVPRIRYQLGRAYLKGDQADQTAIHFRIGANAGYLAAQTELGYLYSSGRGVAKDFRQAIIWYRKAADRGDAYGQFGLASNLEKGADAASNAVEAAEMYFQSLKGGLNWTFRKSSWQTATLIELQKLLQSGKFYQGAIDGIIDQETRAAMMALCNCKS